ncbi:hypothetical protein FG93_00648 [Bosea sp. LC85]|nr:hypothetical protein FG93_00648 [Bosea sp. LC85]
MEHWAPVIQTILWVGLIGVIGWKYHGHIERLLTSLQKRIDSGGGLKIGPVSLDELKPQTEEAQRQAVQNEVAVAASEQSALEAPQQPGAERVEMPPEPEPASSLRQSPTGVAERALLMEDLALRALQLEYGAAITRQISIANVLVDGFAMINGSPHLFEVKYSRLRGSRPDRLERAAYRLKGLVSQMNWHRAVIIICQVYESDFTSPRLGQGQDPHLTGSDSVTVRFRSFRSSELLKRFAEPSA